MTVVDKQHAVVCKYWLLTMSHCSPTETEHFLLLMVRFIITCK